MEAYTGADLDVLVTRGRLQPDDRRLTDRCRRWLGGVTGRFAGTPVEQAEATAPVDTAVSAGFKLG